MAQVFNSGGRPAKTGPELPLATMLDVELPGRVRRILYLFDPAGEHYTGATEVESLRYLDHGEALLFVVDPFALPYIRHSLGESELHLVEESAGTSEEDPADTLQRVLNELRTRPDRGRQKRIGVIVTKLDLLVKTEVGRDVTAGGLRDWLAGVGLGNSVRSLEQVAAEVRFFGSGLSTPQGEVADLLLWASGLASATPPAPPGSASPELIEEVPGTSPLRAPWPVRGRDPALVPLGYQVGRWSVLGGLSAAGLALLVTVGLSATLLLDDVKIHFPFFF
jgi:hypothetical protein